MRRITPKPRRRPETVAVKGSEAVPYGYRKVPVHRSNGKPMGGGFEPDPDKVEIIRSIFQNFESGESTSDIAAAFTGEGVLKREVGP